MPKKTTSKSKSNKKSLMIFLVFLLMVSGAYGIFYYWKEYRNDPVATFNAAINNSLRTPSVNREVVQESQGQLLEQDIEVTFNPTHTARGFTEIVQPAQNTSVKTESITTPAEEYVRYISIDAGEEDGKFSDLIDVWAKTPPSAAEGSLGNLYGEAVLGVVPYANLPGHERKELTNFIRENGVYDYDSDKVQRKIVDGRPVYTYEVTVKPVPYIGMLKKFAEFYGLTQYESLNPGDYEGTQAVTIELKVDAWARHITAINYQDGSRNERVSGYGSFLRPELPQDYISLQELQKRLQEVQE